MAAKTTTPHKIALFVEHTLPLIQNLEHRELCRAYDFCPDWTCSLGAHLAHHFHVSTWDYRHPPAEEPREELEFLLSEDLWDADRGRMATAITIGCAEWQADALLLAAGAPLEPFVSDDWSETGLVAVWQNLARITELPPAHATAFRQWLCAYHLQSRL